LHRSKSPQRSPDLNGRSTVVASNSTSSKGIQAWRRAPERLFASAVNVDATGFATQHAMRWVRACQLNKKYDVDPHQGRRRFVAQTEFSMAREATVNRHAEQLEGFCPDVIVDR
jgi:hypothetical protein